MNHIYKTVWNATLGTWTAVQETAKSHGKSSSGKAARAASQSVGVRFAFTLVASAALLASGQVMAAEIKDGAATGAIIFHKGAPSTSAAAGQDSIVIGTNTQITGAADTAQSSIAIGSTAQVVAAKNAIAFGTGASSSANNAVAIGNSAAASQQSALAVGDGAKALGGQTTAIGVSTNASAAGASAFGHVAKASGEHSTAIGSKAMAKGKSSVALGHEAGVVDDTVVVSQLENVVNIGNGAGKGTTSNIHGIAIGNGAGQNVATAANGGQNTAIGNAAGQNVTGNTNVAISSRAGQHVRGHDNFAALIDAGQYVAGQNNIAIGKEAGRGTQAKPLEVSDTIALGEKAIGGHNGSIAMGKHTVATSAAADNSKHSGLIAIGDTAKATDDQAIAVGKASASSGNRSIAMGAAANAAGASAIAFGTSSSAANKDGIAIGNNSRTGAGENNTAVGSYAQAHTGWSTAVGTRAHAAKDGGFAGGKMAYAKGQDAVATGAYSYANGQASAAIGYQSIVADNAHSSTAIGTGSVVSGTLSGVWNATTRANANAYNNANRSYVGGDNNYAIGNKNIIGDQTSNTFILGNNVKLGATSATLNSTNPLGAGNSIGTRGETVTYTGAQDLDNMVALGSDTKVSVSNGVALGYGSNAATDKGQVGADPLNAVADKTGAAWTSTSAAVAVGDAGNNITRQITGVAAGTQDADAVNVAQLKAVANQINQAGTHYYSLKDQAG
ncbi:MAG: ESPR-type extended signal peptide-containing protein, partial [Brachymonas sp.]|nr:ESPR-type extended signal peptide-containing protein [Brachymonas sp.]